jgi:hypothetical protein
MGSAFWAAYNKSKAADPETALCQDTDCNNHNVLGITALWCFLKTLTQSVPKQHIAKTQTAINTCCI